MSEQYSVLSYLAGKQILDGAWGGLLWLPIMWLPYPIWLFQSIYPKGRSQHDFLRKLKSVVSYSKLIPPSSLPPSFCFPVLLVFPYQLLVTSFILFNNGQEIATCDTHLALCWSPVREGAYCYFAALGYQ